jgi:hypothetical protein
MRKLAIALCIALTTSVFVAAQQPVDSCRKFVEGFYAWYLPRIQKTPDLPILAIKNEPDSFSPALRTALQADYAASAKVKDDIVGIDYDPFLGSQEPAETYNVKNVAMKDGSCFAEIWGKWPASSNDKNPKPDAVAELKPNGDSWQFVNFSYPHDNMDLMGNLAQLAKDRAKKKP